MIYFFLNVSVRVKNGACNRTPTKGKIMSEIIIETPKTHKVRNFIKKHTPSKTQLKAAAVGFGLGAIAVIAAVPFALKRQDEADFDDEFADDEPMALESND